MNVFCRARTRKGRGCSRFAEASGYCKIHDKSLRGKESTRRKRIEGLRDDVVYCRTCASLKPHAVFWDSKKRKYGRTCNSCLSSRRVKSRLRKGKKVYYPAYIRSTAWAEKRSEYWRNGKYRECYMCGARRHPGMQLHHRTYERLGYEQLDDLVPMCEEHHELITRAWKKYQGLEGLTLWRLTDGIVNAYRKEVGLPLREVGSVV